MTALDMPDRSAPPAIDLEELARLRRRRLEKLGAWALPVLVVALSLAAWDWVVRVNDIPHFILPRPGRVWSQLLADWPLLSQALMVTLRITVFALALAVSLGGGLAVLFSLSRWVEMSLFPYAVVLQVTPIVAIAPLIFIYVDSPFVGMMICAWIVAFFPILSNTTLGLRSADRNLEDLFTIYGATRWQRLRYLQLPSAMPYFLGGLRIAGGLALIGAVVAEFAGGVAGRNGGLAFRILEASYRLNVPRMFAALALIAVAGIAIFAITSLVSHLALRRWHESALTRER
ncbi:MAG: ABC transporter permease [Rhodobacteraceae bacterium]|nr:MAG: ABC transporter permease [Paracoccaceae bacterium]